MTLLNPAALIFAALVPVIILLYLLKPRRLSARVSTLMFWQRVTADNRRRALFQRLRQLLSLLLHLFIFALLLLALARPELASFRSGAGAGAGSSTVVVLDCRAQMQARTAGGGTCFTTARLAAEGYLRRASARSPAALLAAGNSPQVLAGFSGDEKALLGGLEHAVCSDAGGSLADAIQLAGDLLAARGGQRRIVVLTDRVPADPAKPPAATLEWRLVDPANTPRDNVAITRLTARPLPNSPQTDEVMLELENFGPTRQSGSVELSLDARTLDVKPYDLAPGERRTEIYPALAARSDLANARGWVTAHLVHGEGARDALPLDDDAFAVIPPLRPLRVLLVTKGNWFLEGLFKADEQLEFNQLAPESFQPARAAGFDAVILDDVLPPGFEKLDALPEGNFLFVRQAPAPLGRAPDAPPSDHPAVTDTDGNSPLLRLVDLRDISFVRAQAWPLPEAAGGAGEWRFDAPVRSPGGPLVVTGEKPAVPGGSRKESRRFVALAFSPTDSVQLPFRVAFPLFVRNSVTFLGHRDSLAADDLAAGTSLRAGETLRLDAGETLWTREQRAYQPPPAEIPAAEAVSGPAIFEPGKNGFYLRRGADGVARWLAVNTFDRTVSALNRDAATTTATGTGTAETGPARSEPLTAGWLESAKVWPTWIYLAVAALVVCTLEWWGFHRRRTE